MRIVIAGPPKTGNVWLKCLLASVYDLRPLGPKLTPERPQLDLFRAWVARGGFKDGSIFHQHYDYSDELADAIEATPARIVTIVRDPYDAFVSSYFTIQGHADDERRRENLSMAMVGKPLDHPDVLAYLRDGYDRQMAKAAAWMHAGRALVVRYEALHRDPSGALTRLTERLAPVPPERLAAAVEACSAENMRKLGPGKAKHVRAAVVGDSVGRLTEAHLAIMRECHADAIRRLGYEVR